MTHRLLPIIVRGVAAVRAALRRLGAARGRPGPGGVPVDWDTDAARAHQAARAAPAPARVADELITRRAEPGPAAPGQAVRIPFQSPLHTPTDLAQLERGPRLARLGGSPRAAIALGHGRLLVTAVLVVFGFGLLTLRVTEVTVLSEPSTARLAARSGVEAPKVRAEIVDREGRLLATSLESVSVYADPKRVLDAGATARALAGVFAGVDPEPLSARLASERRFVWIARHVTPAQFEAVRSLGLPGIGFRRGERRIYPLGRLAAHVVGFTDVDSRGLAGLEKTYNDALYDLSSPLMLSLDTRVQHVMREQLRLAKEQHRAIGAAGIVMDVDTGEILSLVSLPDFDPNAPGDAPATTRFNRASLGIYEMGSTFKIFTTAMALNSGRVTLRDSFDASHPISVGRFLITDFFPKRRWLTVPEIFMYSSNIGMVKMAAEIGVDGQRSFLGDLGLLRPAPLELPEVGRPLAPDPWRSINMMTIAYGHGLAVSPVQLVSAVAAVVNGGMYHNPTLRKRRVGERPRDSRRILESHVSEKMRRLIRLVVTNGTGRRAAARGFLVGGKTGSAEKSEAGGYAERKLISSFVGVFPMHAPRYAVLALLDEPQGTEDTNGRATGGWVAAPVVAQVVERIAPILGVDPMDEAAPEIAAALDIDVLSGEVALAPQ